MRTMPLIVISKYFGSVCQRRIVHRIVESNDLWIIGGWIIIVVIEAGMISINPSIDNSNCAACTVISCILPDCIDAVKNCCVSVCNFKNSIEFKHDNSWKSRCCENITNRHSACQSINSFKSPLMLVIHLFYEHLNLFITGCMVKIYNQWKCFFCIKEKWVLLVDLDHVPNSVSVPIHSSFNPPALFLRLSSCIFNRYSRKHCR